MGLHLLHDTHALDSSADPGSISNLLPRAILQQWMRQSHTEADQDLPGLLVMISEVELIEPVNRAQGRIAHAPDRNSAEIMDIVKMRCDDAGLVLLIFDKLTERKWTGDWEGPGRIGDEHAQEREQGILVLMTEADATTT
ncbi:hypothetical protein IFM58399_06457 [Aspergillus lentulus]|uniref:uncharacterized protein n=1 Tax=Aspergillus lentulus TaxID=293939 RepID=UPI0013925126|nr:uncharacterized protein IFM58399_06457 [Aspergillus lentulus]GFF41995.1 hypothetical protein IFM58399_06457 [Aspergillus lentulus]GFF88530.1 hypothetical protein IFM47457_07846 [Aspergillus lentulus]